MTEHTTDNPPITDDSSPTTDTDPPKATDGRSDRAADGSDAATGHAYRCRDCDSRWYYDRARCPGCGGESFDAYEIGTGTLVAATTSRVTPPRVRDENRLGLAAFDHGVTVVAQVADERPTPEIGDDVTLTGEFALRGDDVGPRLRAATRTDRSDDEESRGCRA